MDAEIKRTVISNIGFKIRDTTAAAAQPGWREEREITGDSTQFAAANRLSRRFQTPGNRETGKWETGKQATMELSHFCFAAFYVHFWLELANISH